jgi:threonine synthase
VPQPDFDGRPWDLWRYRELLPIRDPTHARSLGEGATPLLTIGPDAARAAGLNRGELQIKDEGRNPTGSFKARGMAVAVARAAELGVTQVALPSAGNAGAAAAAYAALHRLDCHVAMPVDAPAANQAEVAIYGADLILVDGLIDAAGRLIRQRADERGWFDLSTLREPYRVEGKKTMGYELAEVGGWGNGWCPDVIVFPTGGGTGIVGMWKAFAELAQLGWIGERRPKLVVVQAAGCAPLVRAFEQGSEHAEPWVGAETIAAGIRVPSAIGDYLVLRAVRESDGTAIAVTDEEIVDAQRSLGRLAGLYTSPEGAATYAALPHLLKSGFLAGDERVVLFNTGMGRSTRHPSNRSTSPATLSPGSGAHLSQTSRGTDDRPRYQRPLLRRQPRHPASLPGGSRRMKWLERFVDRAVTALVARVSGRTVLLISLLLYPGLGLALPLALRWSTPNLVMANVVGVTFAAIISLGWLGLQLDANDRRHLVEWTTNLRLLSAEEFEWMVGELFRRDGWKVRETGRQDAPDGNIDLLLTKGAERRIVQCKRWTARRVGVDEVRSFAGALLREGLRGSDGIFVTLSDFNDHAHQEAQRAGIAVVDGRELYSRVEMARRSEPCQVCQHPMVLARSEHGWWFRCVTAGCAGKRDLGSEPGRAVDLLTQGPPAADLQHGENQANA